MNPSSNRIDGRIIFRVGIALVMVGMLLLFRYTIEWFGPAARLGLGATASAALVVTGILVPRRSYGRLMQGAGAAGGYVTAWAAHGRYDLVDSTTAFLQLVLVATVGVGLAWRERSDILNALGMVGAVAAPLLIAGDFSPPGAEVAYQAALLALAAFLYIRLTWWLTLAVTVVGSGVVLVSLSIEPTGAVLAGIAVWWMVGWVLPMLGRWLARIPTPSDLVGIATLPVPVAAWAMVRTIDSRPALVGTLAAVGAIAHIGVWWNDRETEASVVQLLAGIGFMALALLTWFDAAVAVPIYLLVTSAGVVHGTRVGHRPTTAVSALMGALALPVWLVLLGDGDRASLGAALGDLAPVLIVGVAALFIAGGVQKGAAVTSYLMALAWIAGHLGTLDPGYVTAGFAVVGVAALVMGRARQIRLLTVVGLATVALAVVKLILVDLASADPLLKIALSFGIGVALLAVGYWVGDSSLLGSGEEPEPEPAGERVDG